MSVASSLTLELPDQLVDAVAARVLELMDERGGDEVDPWLNTEEAAEYLRCKPERIHDLVRDGRLDPGRDGRRLIFRRSQLDAYVLAGGGRR